MCPNLVVVHQQRYHTSYRPNQQVYKKPDSQHQRFVSHGGPISRGSRHHQPEQQERHQVPHRHRQNQAFFTANTHPLLSL